MKQIDQVSVVLKANVYFDGKVVSHSFIESNGNKKTVGLIYPGTYKFNTGAPERMDIIAGNCEIKLATDSAFKAVNEGSFFEVPGNSFFEIKVENGITEYLCSFLS